MESSNKKYKNGRWSDLLNYYKNKIIDLMKEDSINYYKNEIKNLIFNMKKIIFPVLNDIKNDIKDFYNLLKEIWIDLIEYEYLIIYVPIEVFWLTWERIIYPFWDERVLVYIKLIMLPKIHYYLDFVLSIWYLLISKLKFFFKNNKFFIKFINIFKFILFYIINNVLKLKFFFNNIFYASRFFLNPYKLTFLFFIFCVIYLNNLNTNFILFFGVLLISFSLLSNIVISDVKLKNIFLIELMKEIKIVHNKNFNYKEGDLVEKISCSIFYVFDFYLNLNKINLYKISNLNVLEN